MNDCSNYIEIIKFMYLILAYLYMLHIIFADKKCTYLLMIHIPVIYINYSRLAYGQSKREASSLILIY